VPALAWKTAVVACAGIGGETVVSDGCTGSWAGMWCKRVGLGFMSLQGEAQVRFMAFGSTGGNEPRVLSEEDVVAHGAATLDATGDLSLSV
jgi:hypothetical protein